MEQLKQIGERLRGLRESLELSVMAVAQSCNIPLEKYQAYETGAHDFSVSTLHAIAQSLGVSLSVLMFGEEPKVTSYFITRKEKGLAVERVKVYSYQALGAGFIDKKVQPFLVTVDPKQENSPIHQNTHPGQEFNLILEGRMQIQINGKDLVLETGDSIYFDATQPHGMKALDGKTVKFLAIII
jgi:transcriptional regulator with XRE-family HTH domain